MIGADKPLLMLGGGNMAAALLRGWCKHYPSDYFIVVDRNEDKCAALQSELGITCYLSIGDLPKDVTPSITCIAVKPNAIADVLQSYQACSLSSDVFISIAAGKDLAFLSSLLPDGTPIIRCMPNTPVAVSCGVSACVANAHTTQEQIRTIDELMTHVGLCSWLEDESLMDIVTAVSGSGPAFLFYYMECVIKTAVAFGLDEEQARSMIGHTMLGTAELANQSDDAISQLREAITSPGGTTQAGLKQLSELGLESIIQQTLEATVKRSKELNHS